MCGFGDEMVDITKAIGAVAATVAALGGSYTLADKFGWFGDTTGDVVKWTIEAFLVKAGMLVDAGDFSYTESVEVQAVSVSVATHTIAVVIGYLQVIGMVMPLGIASRIRDAVHQLE